mmetsp:Transcript_23090/g.54575  ORF Transcript_23090/g.54575 Transcript_23090/m.54575 type:complete len:309 (+) Transcript_23090:204-1130(+)|eukprot:CAMPEP_0197184750 /NCGR_PEP_ID=MMETSP1423-20130617/10478_1 /TAXON_ID=476441 /ORGANISM="Pseudo-nitzschia heimii, Strain UNC1101" /LENGTH=308 /DNA_ID=CAMNT_0042635641 /DNA_START=131 /DNA_END=1057 /DNA_ORIENTATION=+
MTTGRIKISTTKPASKKAKKSKSNAHAPSTAEKILSTMMAEKLKRNTSSISFVGMMKVRGSNDHNTGWRNVWRKLIKDGYIQEATSRKQSSGSSGGGGTPVFTSNYELTDKGENCAGSPDQKKLKELMEATVKTTEEEHARIRKLCMNNRAIQIFDILLKHGSLSRKELAATIGISDRGGPFSYGLRQLKLLGYVVVDETKSGPVKYLMVSNKAFVDPKDRPEPILIDPEVMSANIDKVYGKEIRKAALVMSSVQKEKNIKVEEASVKVETSSVRKNASVRPSVKKERAIKVEELSVKVEEPVIPSPR